LKASAVYEGNQTFTNTYEAKKVSINKNDQNDQSRYLPNTGENQSRYLIIIGVISALLCLIVLSKRKDKN